MRLFKDIQAVSFDFDGVLVLDSDGVFKRDAWGVALGAHDGYEPLLREANTVYGNGRPGGRMEILRFVFQKLGFTEKQLDHHVQNAVDAFENHVQSNIMNAGLVPGAREALEALRARGIAVYLNSGTATGPLNVSIRNLGIDKLIKAALGSTKEPVGGSKVDNLRHIAEIEDLPPLAILMVGDSESDERAAREFGAPFLGVENIHNKWAETEQVFPLVTELEKIPGLIA